MEITSIFSKDSVLQMCVLQKKYKLMLELLKNKSIDINNNNYCGLISKELVWGLTALHVSVLVNDIKAAKLLLSSGADINALTEFAIKGNEREVRKYSSLHMAVISGNQKMVELLIGSNANLNIEDESGLTPIELSLVNPIICAILIGSGADVERFNFCSNKLPLIHRVISLQSLQLVKIFGRLLNKCVYFQNQSQIEYAMNVFPKSVKFLIGFGTGLHSKNEKTGETLLHLAIRKNNENWVQLLLEKGLNTNSANNFGNRSLHIAVFSKCNPRIVMNLVSFGANPNLKNYKGFNALYYAIEEGNVELTQLLFRYGSQLTPQLIELKIAISCRRFKTTLILLNNLNDSQIQTLHTLRFDSEPIIWFFIRHIVCKEETDVNDLVNVLNKLIELGSDVNTIDPIWGTLMHFIIYAMECEPNHIYKPIFMALISSHKCDINQVFEPQNTRTKTGEEIVKERIVGFGNALSFALSLTDCEFFAEELIKVGADVKSFDWDKFWFAPKKDRALKMLFYSGCKFPNDFRNTFEPKFYDFDDTYEPQTIDQYFVTFEAFNKWMERQRLNPWSLKHICRRIVRESFGSVIPKYLVQFMEFKST